MCPLPPDYGDDYRTIQRSQLKQLLSLDNDNVVVSPGESQLLKTFPPEIWIEIFSSMDIKALTTLRSVCKALRVLVSNTPQYKLLYANVPHLIRASLLAEVGSFVTLDQLHQAYISTKCSFDNCEEDAEFIYLFNATRVCVLHICDSNLLKSNEELVKTFQDTRTTHEKLPGIRPIFDEPHTVNHSEDKAFISPKLNSMGRRPHSLRLKNLLKSCLMVPWLDSTTKKNHWGYYCSPHIRRHRSPGYPMMRVIYRRARLLRCCEDCYEAREKWKDYIDDKEGQEMIRKRKREDDYLIDCKRSATSLVVVEN